MEAKNKALEVQLSEEKQMRQDKEQEVGQLRPRPHEDDCKRKR